MEVLEGERDVSDERHGDVLGDDPLAREQVLAVRVEALRSRGHHASFPWRSALPSRRHHGFIGGHHLHDEVEAVGVLKRVEYRHYERRRA